MAAAPITPFAARFQTNDNGAITTVGNNLETCPTAAANCVAARAGSAKLNNNSFNMTFVDADADPTTFNSSNAQLILPAGATVLWAGLYWGARSSAGTGGSAGTGDRKTVSFKPSGSVGYQRVTSQAEFGPTSGDLAYQEFANVTTAVQAAGAGTYWGANVVAGTGEDRYAGWSLSVVYRSPDLPLRNLTVFDGFAQISQGNPQTITVNGFLAPLAGPVDTQLGMVAYEGDFATSGDTATLNSTQLGTALSPGTNFFNGTDDSNGVSVTARSPADLNMLGFDIKNLGASGVIPNGARSANLAFTSTGDTYFPGLLTTAINLYAPDFSPSTKTVVDLAGNDPAQPGDTLRYTLNYTNVGQDPAAGSVASDSLPANTTYVPGSLKVATGANAGSKTDGAGDDQAEFDPVGRLVRFRIGGGANATSGGLLAPSQSTSVSFDVTLDAAAGGTNVTNAARIAYVAQTTALPFTFDVRPVSTDVEQLADLELTKTVAPDPALAGGPITSTLVVVNHGPNAAQNVVAADPLPDGQTATGATATQGTCTAPDGAGTVKCAIGSMAAGSTVTITIAGHTDAASTDSSVTNLATVDSDTPDPTPSDNVAGATVGLSQDADLSITKTANPSSVVPGNPVTFTLVVTNHGPSDAMNLAVTDLVSDPGTLNIVAASAPGANCTVSGPGAQCQLARLPSGATLTVTLQGVTASNATQGSTVDDTATAASDTPDSISGNNQASSIVTVAAPASDVDLGKAASATVIAGRAITYSLTATNNGPSDAEGVIVTDPLPAGVTATNASSNRGDCTITGQVVRCDIGTLVAGPLGQPGASALITIDGNVGPDTPPGPLVNAATVTSASGDPDHANNTATATTQVTGQADLAVTKTATAAVAGTPITYTVTVTNNGPSTALQSSLSDALPGAFGFVSVTPSQGTCPPPVGVTLQCALGSIASGATASLIVTMSVPASFSGTPMTETATASSDTPDPDATNNVASWTSSAGAAADMAITKLASPEPVVAGATLTYTIRPRDLGPSTAAGVVVTDRLPAGVTFISASTGCALSAGAVTCTLGSVDPAFSSDLTINVRVNATDAAGTVFTNSASVSSATPDPSLANNTDTATSTVTASSDLAVTKTVSPGSGSPGSLQIFTIQITNHGPSTARNVTFVDAFNVDAVAAQFAGADCTIVNGELECALNGTDLASGQTATVQIAVLLASYLTPIQAENTVMVSTTTPDSDPSNDTAVAPVDITDPITDVQLTKSSLTDPIVAGSTFTYQLEASVNEAPDFSFGADAQGVVVTDTMPAGLTPTTATTTQGTCTITGPTVTCPVGTMAGPIAQSPPAPVTITISGTVASNLSGPVINSGSVATATRDGVAGNNTATVTTPVENQADLQITKTADDDPFVAGGSANYTVTVTNAGPSDATGVIVTDNLPPAVTFDPEASDPTCSLTTPTVTCNLGVLPAGQTVTLAVAGQIDPISTIASVTNTTSVASAVTDPDLTNNTASVTTSVVQSADLQLAKTADSATPSVGTQLTYTLSLTNSGPSQAAQPAISDSLPAGLQLVAITPTAMTCTSAAGPPVTISCSAPTLAAGSAATVSITAAVPEGFSPGPVTNTATATSSTADPDPGNNTATSTVNVQVVADTKITKTTLTDPVLAGRPVSYQLTAVNNGPATAPDTVITDTLPAGTTFSSAEVTTGTGSCTAVSQEGIIVLNCPVGALAIGVTATITLTIDTPSDLSGTLVNSASVGSGALDPINDNNQSTTSSPVQIPPATDVAVTLVAAAPVATPASPVSLTATVTNNGPSEATNIILTAQVPVQLSALTAAVSTAGTSAAADPPVCAIANQTISCPVGSLDVGAQVSYVLTGTTPSGIAGGTQLTVTATTTHDEADTAPANDTASATVTIQVTTTTSSTPTTTATTTSPQLTATPAAPEASEAATSGEAAASSAEATPDEGALSFTGFSGLPELVAAALMLATGGIIVAGTRRRRRRPQP